MSKFEHEKNRRFVTFLVRFSLYGTDFDAIGIYRKTGPTKSTVLGPIEPEKASLKSASTANPPQKVKFIGVGIKIYKI
jgi:hypothetical protein